MTFRVDLWNGLNIIRNQFTSYFNKLSTLSNVLLSYANYQKTYSKNLESLYKDNKDSIKVEYSLDRGLLELINNFKLESQYHKEHYKYIKKNTVASIKEMLEKVKAAFNNIFNEGIQFQENFIKIKNNLINKQKNYNNCLRDFYNTFSDLDENNLKSILEIDNNSNNDNNPVRSISSKTINISIQSFQTITPPQSNILNEENKLYKIFTLKKEKLIEKINENKDEYINTLNEANDFLKIYRNVVENILQSLEERYTSLINSIHSTLIQTMEQRSNILNKLNVLFINYYENYLKKINIKNEITEFVIRNATKEFPITNFEFISNKFDNNKKASVHITKFINDKFIGEGNINKRGKSRKKTEVRNIRRRPVNKKNTGDKNDNAAMILENNLDFKQYKINTNIYLIEDFISELINNTEEEDEKEISHDDNNNNDSNSKLVDINNIKSLIDKKNSDCIEYLINIFKFLNEYRGKGNFILTKKSYDTFIDLFNYILENFPTIDFILKNILIFSQTFFTKQLNPTSKINKLYIQSSLKNNPVFNNEETWHRVINYTLYEHICNKDISHSIDKNEINNKLNVLSYNTLVSYLSDLTYFTDNDCIYDGVMNFYSRIYQLDVDDINKDVSNIIGYDPTKKSKKEESNSFNFEKKNMDIIKESSNENNSEI